MLTLLWETPVGFRGNLLPELSPFLQGKIDEFLMSSYSLVSCHWVCFCSGFGDASILTVVLKHNLSNRGKETHFFKQQICHPGRRVFNPV